jgi:hypothetical protein
MTYLIFKKVDVKSETRKERRDEKKRKSSLELNCSSSVDTCLTIWKRTT